MGFLLLAYTGARRSEIAKLRVSDVRLDDDSQRYYIMIGDSKTEAGIRQVPISQRLINMGFWIIWIAKGRYQLVPRNH